MRGINGAFYRRIYVQTKKTDKPREPAQGRSSRRPWAGSLGFYTVGQ
ncbi:hypothetical protein HMPREF3293_03102 [Christensenella minuta]|uniref:Uncharacterized protein n=1 Tax=Christensenella minuta TaxID=626937 RepID=A0A136Q0H6_9FIRM|nr:hypothetical protein HMPREF3293_03102 [Christensenella minuta]